MIGLGDLTVALCTFLAGWHFAGRERWWTLFWLLIAAIAFSTTFPPT